MTDQLTQAPQVAYPITQAEIDAARERYGALTIAGEDDAAGYDQVFRAIRELTGLRGKIEAKRVEMKAESLEWGRKVDAEAKRWRLLIESIEEPLRQKRLTVDNAKAAREKAEIDRLKAEEAARLKAERDAEEARLKALRDAETERNRQEALRLAEERKALESQRAAAEAQAAKERQALAAKQAEIEAEQARERARVAEERRLIEEGAAIERARVAEMEAQARAEQERREKLLAESQRKFESELQAHRRKEAEEREAKLAADRAAAAEAQREAMAPDLEKVNDWAAKIRAVTMAAPTVTSPMAKAEIDKATEVLGIVAQKLTVFAHP